MREVFREYGTMVIAVLLAVLLFFLVFGHLEWKGNVGLMNILGQGAKIGEKDFTNYKDSKETIQAMEQKRPVITYKNIHIKTGDVWHEDALFMAEDVYGNPAETEVLQVIDSVGNEVIRTDENIKFERQGIYQCQVRATDSNCGVTEQIFWIPVRCR